MLDRLYGSLALARRRWAERHPERRDRLARPVISIGNLTVGGSGKTPVVAALASYLIERGERPSILSRGYRRAQPTSNVTIVSDGTRVLASVATAGDEPLMLARAVPGAIVCVHANRYDAGVVAEQTLGATVHLLDDGFQHLRLARDLDVLVTGPGDIAGGRVLPFGRLREPATAAARAQLLILVGGSRKDAAAEAWNLGIGESAAAAREIGEPRDLALDRRRPIVAAAGIAHPQRFFDALAAAGWLVAKTLAWRDHHRFGRADLDAMAEAVRATGAQAVLTTDKDAVRLEPLAPFPVPIAAVPMRLAFDGWDTVTGVVSATIARVRRERPSPAAADAS